MADGEKGDEAEGELTVVDWHYRLLSPERVQADTEEDGQDSFIARFQVDGPNATAEVEITVTDFRDEAHVISIAQHTPHVATTWGRVTWDRLIRARAGDLPKRGAERRLWAGEVEKFDGEEHDRNVAEDGLGWTLRLKEVVQIEAAPGDDDPLKNLFAVDGPNAEAEVEIMVPDATDLEGVGVALDTLQGSLLTWAELIRRRREAAWTEMPEV